MLDLAIMSHLNLLLLQQELLHYLLNFLLILPADLLRFR